MSLLNEIVETKNLSFWQALMLMVALGFGQGLALIGVISIAFWLGG